MTASSPCSASARALSQRRSATWPSKSSPSAAVKLGLARALKDYRPDLEPALREHELLTRDARKVERKKYGHKKARKSFQFSKR